MLLHHVTPCSLAPLQAVVRPHLLACRISCRSARGGSADPENQWRSARWGFCKFCRKPLLGKAGFVLQRWGTDVVTSRCTCKPHVVHGGCRCWAAWGSRHRASSFWVGAESHSVSQLHEGVGACEQGPAILMHLRLPPHSQAEFQQRGSLVRQHNPQRGGRRGADGHQSVSEVPHHIPAHPAARSRSRLQARPGGPPAGAAGVWPGW